MLRAVDVCEDPSANKKDKKTNQFHSRRCLKLWLTDGVQSFAAIEALKCPQFDATPPLPGETISGTVNCGPRH